MSGAWHWHWHWRLPSLPWAGFNVNVNDRVQASPFAAGLGQPLLDVVVDDVRRALKPSRAGVRD